MVDKSIDVLCIGEALVELSCEGDVRYAAQFERSYGGDAFNTAITTARMGPNVGFLTRLGDDPFAQALRHVLRKESIETFKLAPVEHAQTGLYVVRYQTGGPRDFLYYRSNSAAGHLTTDAVTPQMIEGCKLVFATGNSLIMSESGRNAVLKAFKLAKKAGVMTVFDPNYRPRLWRSVQQAYDVYSQIFPFVDVIMPSFPDDTADYLGFSRPTQALDYFWSKDIPIVVVKAAEHGAYIGLNGQAQHVPVKTIMPTDPTGAGDVFNGAFMAGLVARKPLVECVKLANTAAGLKIRQRGMLDAIPTREAVLAALHS